MIRILAFLISLLCWLDANAHPREMFLAGGAMHICSSLAVSDCSGVPASFRAARGAPRFRIDDAAVARALSPNLWPATKSAPTADSVRALLTAAAHKTGKRELDADAMFDVFDGFCARAKSDRLGACRDNKTPRPWRSMLDGERSALLAALEVPALGSDQRRREIASLEHSKRAEGVAILRAFVAAAAKRSPGRKPLIAVVTASSNDTFDPVDFYLSALREAGAEPVWWPLDAALAAAVHGGKGCDALAGLRLEKLALPAREAVFPDLVAAQLAACRNPQALLGMADRMQGIFFSGGDQWRLRQAFFDDEDQPNPWLKKLRTRYARGQLVVGGTSAGTAVQSARAMLSNGETARALARGAVAGVPPAPGCTRAQRCAPGQDEGDLTFWRAGGLALEPGWVFDTHFSERARELRLLQLLHDSGTRWGIGVDETSAVHLRSTANGVEVEALGASGAWIFDFDPALQTPPTLRARVHYLAPGARMVWADQSWTLGSASLTSSVDQPARPITSNALEGGALRAAAARLGSADSAFQLLHAGQAEVRLLRTEGTRSWSAPAGQIGISNMLIEYSPASQPQP